MNLLEFLKEGPGLLAGIGLGSLAGAWLLGRLSWRQAGDGYDGSLLRLGVMFGTFWAAGGFAATFLLAVAMLLSRLLRG